MTDTQWTAVKSELRIRLKEAGEDLVVELDRLRRDHNLEEDFYADMLRRARLDDPGFDFTMTIRRAYTHVPVQMVCRYSGADLA